MTISTQTILLLLSRRYEKTLGLSICADLRLPSVPICVKGFLSTYIDRHEREARHIHQVSPPERSRANQLKAIGTDHRPTTTSV
jgi:hypothetical protein